MYFNSAQCYYSRHVYAFKGLDRVSVSVCEMTIRYVLCITPLRIQQVAASGKMASATVGSSYLSLIINSCFQYYSYLFRF